MEISFFDRKLATLANNDRLRIKALGKVQADKVNTRLAQLWSATNLEEVRYLPGNYHELINNRKGQWACDLNQPYRLIFTPHEKPIPVNEYGQYEWALITGVKILEIINYHKDN